MGTAGALGSFGLPLETLRSTLPHLTPPTVERTLRSGAVLELEWRINPLASIEYYFKDGRLSVVRHVTKYSARFEDVKAQHEAILKNFQTLTLAPTSKVEVSEWPDRKVRIDTWKTADGTEVYAELSEATRGEPLTVSEIIERNDRKFTEAVFNGELEKRRNQRAREEAAFDAYLKTFVGQNVDALAIELGAPSQVVALPSGSTLYVWERRREEGMFCRTSVFTKGRRGQIYSFKADGNLCRRVD